MPKERDKIFLPYILLLLSTAALIHHISASDADVMAKLATSLSPTPGGWVGPNFCKWLGVSCDSSSKVTSINLSSKSLSGTIPSEINQLSALKTLSLQRNQLSGPLPPLTNMGSLEDVNLDENGFNSIPTGFLSGLSSLQSFSINNNSNLPPWTIPSTLKDSSSLTSFIASKSNIVGEIPDIFGSLPNFHSLRLSYNNLTGSLPSSFADSGIENLWINNQIMGFSGPIDVIGYMTQLKTVWFHGNKFSGGIPDLSACTELNDLVLRDNELTGVIPDSLTKLPKLQNVALQNNIFQGPMPSFSPGVQVNLGTSNTFCLNTPGPCDSQVTALLEVASAMYYPKTLAESWKGNNPCQDWKFITCDKGNVAIINFAKQNFNGLISPSFANLPNLKSIFLNDNQLEGTIPDSLTGLKNLQILDLSNNNISGKVPSFPSTVTVRLSGNINIGKDVPLSARAQGYSSHNHGNGNQKGSSFPIWAIFLIVLALVIVLAILSFVIYKRYFTKKKHGNYKWFTKQSGSGKGSRKTVSSNGETKDNNFDRISNISNSIGESSSPEKSDYHVQIPIEVIREATDNFNEKNIIGKGGFGVVYRGKLHDGTQIAVKRMESSLIDKGLNEFKAEIEVLSKVKHRHLVALHGFCDNGNERLLVYEYMPQGCLNRHLFHWLDSGLPPLTWNQRVIVALDVARGVEYLHSLAQQSFIHRDLKPSNILLGDDMRAKVSDFGLVKSAPDGKYSVETRLAGTFGYLAPEYAATGRVTTKVDVFAFGIILMEIISGRKALDDSLPEDRAQLVSWFRRLLIDKEAIRGGLDPVLTTTIDEENFQSIWKVAELAGHCTAREPYQRPDMSHAVNVLSTLVEQWTPAPDEDDSFRAEFHMSLPQVLKKWKATDDSSSTMNSDFYNGNSTNTYSTSSNSTAMMKKPSQFTSSFEDH